MRFIRKNGRVIPIRDDSGAPKPRGVSYKGAGMAIGGATLSIGGANRVAGAVAKRFGNKLGFASMLGTIFVGEAVAAEGIDRFTESLRLKKRKEQNVKNVAGGLVGVMGALSAFRHIRR